MKKKLYLLDTNVLIHDARALFAFKGAWIGIAMPVLEELDKFKTETSARGRNAREAIRTLDKLRERGSLSEGVVLEDGATIQILLAPADMAEFGLDLSENDNKILSIALSMRKKHDLEVHFISKDLNMRVKADALGLLAEDYRREHIAEDDFYKGWISVPVHAGELQHDQPSILQAVLNDHQLFYNEYVQLVSERNPENYRIFRYCGEKVFKSVVAPRGLWGIVPRNPQQYMAFDLLFNDDIQLVALFGPAGTGKTFLVLVSALHKLLIEHAYKKILVARPVEPLGRDIGYLPGDMQEKLYSWMQPVRDNWEFIASRAHSSSERGVHEGAFDAKDGERKVRRGKGKGGKDGAHGFPTIEELMREDRLSLEAITYMRGRSIPKQYILIDEVQNLTPHEVKTLVTRVGEGSKIVLAGDPYQIDSPYLDFASNGLVVTNERFKGQRIFGSVFLEKSERSELSDLAAQLL
ncbi:MAG: PhoH-like protein [candidate division TM6 bacterium GW2011_GWE2_42_60]|nr:MAG: PhoH-like protein [candidate division TM6 bacterium GW2011_GWE2_42_60]HBY06127.1 phosphate starvation-inducible protein PhoH [Candidatus Dependentiae bacterium]